MKNEVGLVRELFFTPRLRVRRLDVPNARLLDKCAVYPTCDAAGQDVFEYIEMFYNPKRKHTNNGMLSPVHFETSQQKLIETGV